MVTRVGGPEPGMLVIALDLRQVLTDLKCQFIVCELAVNTTQLKQVIFFDAGA